MVMILLPGNLLSYPVEKFAVAVGIKILRSRVHKTVQKICLDAFNIDFL